MGRRTFGIIISAGALLVLASCSGPRAIDSSDSGRTRAYEPGVPNFDMETVVRARGDSAVVEVHLSIPFASLVFVRDGEAFAAAYEMVAEVTDRSSKSLVEEQIDSRSLRVSDYDSTLSMLPHVRRLDLHVPAGSHVVQITLTDLKTGESVRRRQAVSVPALGEGEPYVSRIHLEARRDGHAFEPHVSLHMPAMMDSLRASIQLLNVRPEGGLTISMELVRFESDTSVASPPYWLVPPRGSLAYRGVFYDKADTLQVTRRDLGEAEGDAVVEFSLPQLNRGMFGLTIEGTDSSDEPFIQRERILSVKNETFPQIALLDDLVEALAYIAYESEIEFIQEAETPAEKKRRLDAFWGSLVPNRNLAANLIKLYYGRIEEANLFFTGHKEGWKTDRGMVYVVMGPPFYVDRRVNTEIWHYSYADENPVKTFVFEKAQNAGDDVFVSYILERRPYYQQEWFRAIDLWRSGDVL